MGNYTPTEADLQEFAEWADEMERQRDPDDAIRDAWLDAEEARHCSGGIPRLADMIDVLEEVA